MKRSQLRDLAFGAPFSSGAALGLVLSLLLGAAAVGVWANEHRRCLDTPVPRVMLEGGRAGGAASAQQRPGDKTLGVALRLSDVLDSARLDGATLDAPEIKGVLTAHWRRQKAPFVGPEGALGRYVQHIGLERVRGQSMAERTGDSGWKPDNHLWGLDDGSFDQRESLLLPAGASWVFPLRVPGARRFHASLGLLGEGRGTLELALQSGTKREVLGRVAVSANRRWTDYELALPSGVTGELVLSLKAESGQPLIGLLGAPVLLAPGAAKAPFNVLYIIVDALRSDAVGASHEPAEDARRRAAAVPPQHAVLPRLPEVSPEIDRLAARGAVFSEAYSAAMWTRPSTIAMLTGQRASRSGVPVLELVPGTAELHSYYAHRPPLLSLSFRAAGSLTHAIVNNMYLCGYLGVGVDTGFEGLVDHRYQTLDTRRITDDTVEWLRQHHDERFTLLVNYASPHAPYVPESQFLEPIERNSAHPDHPMVRRYLGEVRKDDAAIGELLAELDRLGLRDSTAIVVTADHGETMSESHDIVAVDVARNVPSGRFTHLSTMWDEAARVALVMSLPGKIPEGKRFTNVVQNIDVFPTLLELAGLKLPDGLDARSLRPLFDGQPLPERPLLVEGRGAVALRDGHYRLIWRQPVARKLERQGTQFEKTYELYDLESDPGERQDLAAERPEVVAQLRLRIEALLSEQVASTAAPTGPGTVSLRFVTAGHARALVGHIKPAKDASPPTRFVVTPVGVDAAALEQLGLAVEINARTSTRRAIGFDIELEPPETRLEWSFTLDGRPLSEAEVFGGELGWAAPELLSGLPKGFSGTRLDSLRRAHLVPQQEQGLFVTRRGSSLLGLGLELDTNDQAQAEAQRAMEAWGYSRKSSSGGH